VRQYLWGNSKNPAAEQWSADNFVRLMCDAVAGKQSAVGTDAATAAAVAQWCRDMQHYEWELLLQWCYSRAVGSSAV
jgi:hypothetical protein